MKVLILSLFLSISAFAAPKKAHDQTHANCAHAKAAVAAYYERNDRAEAYNNRMVYEPVNGGGPNYKLISTKPKILSCKAEGEAMVVKIQVTVYADTGFGGTSGQYPRLEKIRKPREKYTREIHVYFEEGKWKPKAGDLYPEFLYVPAATAAFSEGLDSCKVDKQKDACEKSVGADLKRLKVWARKAK